MGEARRRRQALKQGPCRCGSDKNAGACCLDGEGNWFKKPASLDLRTPRTGRSVAKCYMNEMLSCEGGLSGEHLISRSVIELLAGGGNFKIAGTPWLPEGEFKTVGTGSFRAKCLCERHNSKLHPLDDAARFLFRVFKTCFEDATHVSEYLVSGHDVERWLLKTLKALAASRNLGQGRERLAGAFCLAVPSGRWALVWQPARGRAQASTILLIGTL